MELRIDKTSDIPVRQQLAEQIIFSIATEKLKPGEALPSVRELARRLKIHRNTVSQAYRDLKRRAWITGLRGGPVIVRARGRQTHPRDSGDLDDLINATIHMARERGYTLQALRERVRARLLAQVPDRILVVEQELALCKLLQHEIRAVTSMPVEGCSLADLIKDRGLVIGALPVAAQYVVEEVDALLPKDMPAIHLIFNAVDEQTELLRTLQHPSVIAVVSISEVVRKTAGSLLAPAVGQRHALREFRFPLEGQTALRAADIVFADSIAFPQLKHARIHQYRLIRPSSLEYLLGAIKSYGLS
jgi:GntR family transcriptional regulator